MIEICTLFVLEICTLFVLEIFINKVTVYYTFTRYTQYLNYLTTVLRTKLMEQTSIEDTMCM